MPEVIENETKETIETQEPIEPQTTETTEETPQEQTPGETEKKYYSVEDLRSMDVDSVDVTKVNPEHLTFYQTIKEINSKKSQEIAAKEKEFKENLEKTKTPPQPVNQREQLYQVYKQNPQQIITGIFGEVQKINQAILQLEQTDPMSEAYAESRKRIADLQGMKDNLVFMKEEFATRKQQEGDFNNYVNEITNKVHADIYKTIPDFNKRGPELEKFAMEKLGLTKSDLEYLYTPAYHRDVTTRIVAALNKAYEMSNPEKALRHKENRMPPHTENVGAGHKGTSNTLKGNVQHLYDKAVKSGKTGDWSRYVQAQIDYEKSVKENQ